MSIEEFATCPCESCYLTGRMLAVGALEEADAHHDDARGARARHERDALLEKLARATGLGGRSRRAGSSAERARLNVTRTIRHAVKEIAQVNPELAAHLDRSVRTGSICVYEPTDQVTWRL